MSPDKASPLGGLVINADTVPILFVYAGTVVAGIVVDVLVM